jgi:hypothetical protein
MALDVGLQHAVSGSCSQSGFSIPSLLKGRCPAGARHLTRGCPSFSSCGNGKEAVKGKLAVFLLAERDIMLALFGRRETPAKETNSREETGAARHTIPGCAR